MMREPRNAVAAAYKLELAPGLYEFEAGWMVERECWREAKGTGAKLSPPTYTAWGSSSLKEIESCPHPNVPFLSPAVAGRIVIGGQNNFVCRSCGRTRPNPTRWERISTTPRSSR